VSGGAALSPEPTARAKVWTQIFDPQPSGMIFIIMSETKIVDETFSISRKRGNRFCVVKSG